MKVETLDFWSTMLLIAVLVFVVLVAVSYYRASEAASTSQSVTLSQTPQTLGLGGQKYVLTLKSLNTTSGAAVVYLQKLPAFLNPELRITLRSSNITFFNTGMSGSYADAEMKLTGISQGSASATIALVNESYRVPVSAALVSAVSAVSYTGTTKPPAAQNASTTVSTRPTSKSTTTVNQAQIDLAEAQSLLSQNASYALMKNYSTLYTNTRNCTATLYTSTYRSVNGAYPSGPATYQNITQITPYAMQLNISKTGTSVYTAIFKAQSHNPVTTGAVAQFTVDISTGSVTGVKFEGMFGGMNYTKLESIYSLATATGNACGILVQ